MEAGLLAQFVLLLIAFVVLRFVWLGPKRKKYRIGTDTRDQDPGTPADPEPKPRRLRPTYGAARYRTRKDKE